jgi:D-lactate dehydrogenase (cytochrome)
MVGSEGTLGILTEVTVKIYPQPESVSAAICNFPDIAAAVSTAIQIIQMGVPIARCELLDANAVRAVNQHDKLTLRVAPMLLMEFHGSEASVAEQARTVGLDVIEIDPALDVGQGCSCSRGHREGSTPHRGERANW